MKVRLCQHEVELASGVGLRRQLEAMRRGLSDRHGHDGPGWNLHIEGACGELAVAKLLGRYWDGSCNTFKVGGDVGSVQVRTRSKPDYDLIIRDGDRDTDYFILVTGSTPEFEVHGYILGSCAKAMDRFKKEHGGRPSAWFVPSTELTAFPQRYEAKND